MRKSTLPSIGWIMSGTEPNPTAVGSHVDTIAGNTMGLLLTANREARTIVFIIAPGIATLANDCQIRVSVEDTSASNTAVGDPFLLASSKVACPEVAASAKQ
jgi:hypothetical protein